MGWTIQLETDDDETSQSSPACLPVFEGWTVDVRLQEFRRVTTDEEDGQRIEYMSFESLEGEALFTRYVAQADDGQLVKMIGQLS